MKTGREGRSSSGGELSGASGKKTAHTQKSPALNFATQKNLVVPGERTVTDEESEKCVHPPRIPPSSDFIHSQDSLSLFFLSSPAFTPPVPSKYPSDCCVRGK